MILLFWLTYTSTHIAKWVAESNRPVSIVSNPELINLLTTGHPHLTVLSPNTVQHDIKAAYRCLAFTIVRSTTIALPAWRRYCKELNLKSRILPRNVVTCWNSTYYMLSFAVKYHSAIDAMMADKSLKLRNYELETEEWSIAEDLMAILLVCIHIVEVINPQANPLP